MSSTCMHVRALLVDAIGGHANQAGRLELEAHLEGCARCRADHDALEPLRRLRGWEPTPLPDAARERVRLAALAGRSATSPPQRSRRAPALLVAAVAAAALLVFLRPRPESRILDGDVVASPGDARGIADGARLSAIAGGHVVLGSASVELAAGTALSWHAAARTVTLERGAVTVEVDPRRKQHFRVATPRFAVEVMGTRFTVTLDGVRTERGKVRVLGSDGSVQAMVAAGERWSAAPPPAPVAPAPPAAPSPPAAPPAPAASATRPAAPAPSAEDRLARAHEALSAGEAHAARQLLQPILHGPRALAAEANLVYAESFLVERRHADAIARYRSVLRAFDGTPQAESALYAIAQLELEDGARDAAAQTLARYLERHPAGRFADEARERLARLRPQR